jgi:hypothetical protein
VRKKENGNQLADERERPPRSAADADLAKAKAALVWLRVREKERQLVDLEEALWFTELLVGTF